MKNKDQKQDYGTTLLSWKAPEYQYYERSRLWYMLMGIVSVSLIVYGILANSLSFSIVIVLLVGVFTLTHKEKPKIVDIVITDTGLCFDHRFYPYEDLKIFWIIFDPPHVKTLNFRTSRISTRELGIQLGDQNPAEIRALLSTQMPEWKNRTETLSEVLIRIFKL
jgi:hypothetical protein